ncbi:hypothetical protein MMC31_000988 [Peltigera leucophlebia]|nr:hypothetical protein [Peltigera leucophlebia]
MVRPYKRRRLSEHDSPAEIFERRARLDLRLKSRFESIFEKYGKDFSGIGDEIDLETGEIVVNHGHVDCLRDETDPGRPEDLFDELNPDEESSTPIIRLTRTSSHYTRKIVSMRITSQLDAESVDDIDDLGLEFSDTKRQVLVDRGRMSLPNQVGPSHLAKSDSKLFYKSRQSYPPIAIASGPPALEPLYREATEPQWWVPPLPKSSMVTRESVPASPCLPLQDGCDRSPSPPCYSIWSCKEASSVYRNGDSVLSKQSISISAKGKTSRAVNDKCIDNVSSSTVKVHVPHVTRTEFHRKAQENSDKPQAQQTGQKSTFRFARIPIKVVKPPIQPEKTAKPQNISLKITRSQAHRKDSLTFKTENPSLKSGTSVVQQEHISVVSHKSKQWERNIHGRLVVSQTNRKEDISNGLVKKAAGKDGFQGKPAKDSSKPQLQTIQVKQARALHGEGLKPAEENAPGHSDGVRGTLPRTMSEPQVEEGSVHPRRHFQQRNILKSLLDDSPLHGFRHPSRLSKAASKVQEKNDSTNLSRSAQKDEAMQSELKPSPVHGALRRGRSSKAISESQEENRPVQTSGVTQQKEALKPVVTSPFHVSPQRRGRYSGSNSKSQVENIPVRRNGSTQREGALKLEGEISPVRPIKRRGRPPKAIAKSEVENRPVQLVGAPAVQEELSDSPAEKNATNSVKFSVQQENDPKPQSPNMSVKPQIRSPEDILKSQAVNSLAGADPTRKDIPGYNLHAPAEFGEISVTREAKLGSEQSQIPKKALMRQVRQKDSLRSQLHTPVKVSKSHVKPRIASISLRRKGKWAVDDLSEDELSTPSNRVGHLEGKASKL